MHVLVSINACACACNCVCVCVCFGVIFLIINEQPMINVYINTHTHIYIYSRYSPCPKARPSMTNPVKHASALITHSLTHKQINTSQTELEHINMI